MLFQTHLVFGFFIAIVTKDIFNFSWIYVLILTLTSSLPDIDTPRSWIGKRTKPISSLIHFLFRHRTITHGIFPITILAMVIYYANLKWLALALLIGYLSHLLLDSLTISGIRPFYPLRFRLRGPLKTGGFIENMFLYLIIGISSIYLAISYFPYSLFR